MTEIAVVQSELELQQVPDQPAAAIRWHEQAADLLTERADVHRWEAARLIASELESGKTQRALAAEIGKSPIHVSYMARVWRDHGVHHGVQERSFDSFYQEVKAKPPAPELPAPEPEPDEQDTVEGELVDEPDEVLSGQPERDDSDPAPLPPRQRQASRRPLTIFASESGWKLRESTERIERIFADDRFARNKEEVATHLRGHLQHTVEVCQDLLDRLNEMTGE